jgi:glucose-6-phosphate dehydrogenase assembly protein OpcA
MEAPVSATAAATPPIGAWEGEGVGIGDVLGRLAEQRRREDGRAPYTLAGVLNLVAHAPDPGDLEEMRAVVESLADHQPSRAVLVVESGDGQGIDASVITRCRSTGDDTGIAVEVVALTLHGDAREGAASAVLPLLRADLPTVLWWPAAPDPSPTGALARLAGLAHRIVTEAGRGRDAAGCLRALASWAATAERPVTDLAWAAITPWRQLIAQMLDKPSLLALRSSASAALITHAAPDPDVETLLMAAWLKDLLGERLMVELHPRPGPDAGLIAVELEGSVAGRRLTVERVPGRPAAAVCVTEPDGRARRRMLPLPAVDRARLLAGELEIQRRDRAFERTLAAAVGR